jgi:hypothetical protein
MSPSKPFAVTFFSTASTKGGWLRVRFDDLNKAKACYDRQTAIAQKMAPTNAAGWTSNVLWPTKAGF